MTYANIVVTERAGIAELKLNRPDRLNAITGAMLEELCDALDGLVARRDVRVAVLCGEGRAFAAGVDLKDLEIADTDLAHGDVGAALNEPARRLTAMIEAVPFPVIAKVHGACFTGALELALACDWIVAADDTKFGDTHAKLGIRPTWGMTARLSDAVGVRRARELSFTARTFSGTEAAAYGMVTTVLPADQIDRHVDDLCQSIAANSADSVAVYKRLYVDYGASVRRTALETERAHRPAGLDAKERIADFLQSMSVRK